MGLNIKNEEAHRLAQELASLTGTSLTTAVVDALRDQLALKRKRNFVEKWIAIGNENAKRLKNPIYSGDVDALLYDENGLPK